MCLGPLAARRAEATLCPTRGRNGARHARVHAVPACGARRSPAVSGASKGWRWWEGRVRSGAESPDDRLLNLERHGEQVGRGATPHPASPARSGGRPAVPTPRATPPRTLGRQPRPLPLRGGGGGGGTHSPLGVETKTKPRTRCAHTCVRTRRVLNQAAAGLTGQQRRRRQKERASEPEAPGRVAGGGGERRRGVWTRRGPRQPGPHDVSRSAASTWHQPVGNWRRALF